MSAIGKFGRDRALNGRQHSEPVRRRCFCILTTFGHSEWRLSLPFGVPRSSLTSECHKKRCVVHIKNPALFAEGRYFFSDLDNRRIFDNTASMNIRQNKGRIVKDDPNGKVRVNAHWNEDAIHTCMVWTIEHMMKDRMMNETGQIHLQQDITGRDRDLNPSQGIHNPLG